MTTDDPELEQFLRQFEPRRPRPIRRERSARLWAWAAAAALAVAGTGALLVRDLPPGRADPDAGAAVAGAVIQPSAARAAVVIWNEQSIDRLLTELSPRVLPDVGRRDRTLHALAGY
jgi:hypothetical protein